jgi:hypothetical protein
MPKNRGGSSQPEEEKFVPILFDDERELIEKAKAEAEEQRKSSGLGLPRNISRYQDSQYTDVGIDKEYDNDPEVKKIVKALRTEQSKEFRRAVNGNVSRAEDPQYRTAGGAFGALFGGLIGGNPENSETLKRVREGKKTTASEDAKAAIALHYGKGSVEDLKRKEGWRDKTFKEKKDEVNEQARKAGELARKDIQGTDGGQRGFWGLLGEALGLVEDKKLESRSAPQQLSIEDVPGYEPPKGGIFGEDVWTKRDREQRNAKRLEQSQQQSQGQAQEEEDTSVSDFVKWFFGAKE